MQQSNRIFLSLFIGVMMATASSHAWATTTSVDAIEAQPLPKALKSFAQATGLQLVYVSEIAAGLDSRGARAGLSPQESLQALLSGTGLTFEFVNDRTVSIRPGRKSGDTVGVATRETASAPARYSPNLTLARVDTTPAESADEVDDESKSAARKDSKDTSTEVVVTGSRIRTLNSEVTAIPVYSINQVELERRGVNRLADIRWAIPQLAASIGFNDNLQNSGTSRAQTVSTSFNLRGLGGNSTLILVNGRRVPHTGQEAPGGAGGREDFSVDGIPVSAIERIDILPQGAGAIYGSEAIAGVINIVLKERYSGIEARASYETPFDTDVAQKTISMTGGFRSGKLGTFITASLEDQNGLAARDRWFTSTYDSRVFGSTSTSFLFSPSAGPGTLASGFYPVASPGAALPGESTHVVGIPVGSSGTTAANSAYTLTEPQLFDAAPYSNSIDPAQRMSVTGTADYALTDSMQLYAEGRWARFENEYFGSPITITGISLPVGYPGNPFSTSVILSKVFYDLPRPHIVSEQENLGMTLGMRGEFLRSWRYDVSAAWARNIVRDDTIVGSLNFGLLNAAVNSASPPLLAYDSFNGTNPNAAGVLESLLPGSYHEDTTDVYQYSAIVDGTLWSGWAGDIRLAAGLEVSTEEVKFNRTPAGPSYLLSAPFSRDSNAAFAELSVPLLSRAQNIPLVHRLEVGAAVRYQDYSDVGDINIPTFRALFQPVEWLTLRGSRAEGFKPPRLYDLLAPVSTFTTTLTATRGYVDNERGGEAVVGTFQYMSGGNPTLNPERSVSRNIGLVLDIPGELFSGLSFSVDYYELDYNERSGGPAWQVLFDFFPERVTRAAPTPTDIANGYSGLITGWDSSNINLSSVTTSGWDYRMTFQRVFDIGEVLLTLARTDSDPTFTMATPAATPTSNFGHQPVRTSGSAFWSQGPWDGGLSVNHQSGWRSTATSTAYPSYIEFNPQLSYDFGDDARFNSSAQQWWARWLADGKVSLTVINALNKEPAVQDVANGRVVVDPRLRRYILSVSKSF